MQDESTNKMIRSKKNQEKEQEKYFFPDQQVTIDASSQEEAEQKLKEVIIKNK